MEKKMKKFAMTDQTKRILIAILFIIVIGLAGIITILSSTHFLKNDNPTNEAKGPGVENGYVYVNPASKIVPDKGQAVQGGEAATTAYAGETDTTPIPTSVSGDDTIPGASYAAQPQATNNSSSDSESNTNKGTVTKTINNIIDSIGNEIKKITNTISGNSSTSSASEENDNQAASSDSVNSSVSDNNNQTISTDNNNSSTSSSIKNNVDNNSESSKDSSSDVKNSASKASSTSNESSSQQKTGVNLSVKNEK